MQWSDETVERVKAEYAAFKYSTPAEQRYWAEKALAAVAECKEVRELVEAAQVAERALIGKPLARSIVQVALAPFTEGK